MILDVQIIVVFRPPGIVMETTIAEMALMNPQSTVAAKDALVSEISSLVITETVFLESTSVMETMIAWITVMKTTDTNATIANVTKKLNSPVLLTRHGAELNVYPRNGYAMEIQIVLTEPMRIQLCIVVRHLNLVAMISLLAEMEDVLIRVGYVITIMIAVMVLTKEKNVIHNTRLVRHKNLPVKTLNVFVTSIIVMEKMIAVIIPMKSIAKRKIIPVQTKDNSSVTVDNALTSNLSVTKSLTVLTIAMNHFIVMLTSVPK